MLAHKDTIPGLSDGGAHVGMICDGSFPTTLITHWARDRSHGRLPLEFLIKRQAHDTARALGLTDRGLLRPGLRADVNLIDLDRLALLPPDVAHDLPAGGQRWSPARSPTAMAKPPARCPAGCCAAAQVAEKAATRRVQHAIHRSFA
jgi:N-acyl-D-aspartate/D-glutamate deacylase